MIHVATLQDLADLVADLRRGSGMSYRTLAKDAGVNTGTLITIEHARNWPRTDTCGRLLQYYGETVTIGWDPNGKGGSSHDYGCGSGQQGR